MAWKVNARLSKHTSQRIAPEEDNGIQTHRHSGESRSAPVGASGGIGPTGGGAIENLGSMFGSGGGGKGGRIGSWGRGCRRNGSPVLIGICALELKLINAGSSGGGGSDRDSPKDAEREVDSQSFSFAPVGISECT